MNPRGIPRRVQGKDAHNGVLAEQPLQVLDQEPSAVPVLLPSFSPPFFVLSAGIEGSRRAMVAPTYMENTWRTPGEGVLHIRHALQAQCAQCL